MAISVQAGAVNSGLANLTMTPALPADVAAGDLLLLFIGCGNDVAITSGLTGWTQIHTDIGVGGTNGDRFYVYKKTTGSSETAPTVTLAGASYQSSVIVRVRGHDPAGPAQITAGSSATATPSIDPPAAGSIKIGVAHIDPGVAGNTTWSGGATQLANGSADTAAHLGVAYKTEDTAGALSFSYSGSPTTVATLILSIAPAALAAPVAGFTGTPLTGDAPLTVAFTDTSTNTPTGWAWDFGDGGTSTSQNPSHNYTTAGSYTVALVASNAGGSDTETKAGYVTITAVAIEGVFSIAFDAAWDVADPVWTRIDTLAGCRVRDWTVDRGRPNEFDRTDTGTAVVRIVDRAGLFDPTNASSPYYGKVLPGKQAAIALQNPISDEWFTQFRGFIESWQYRLDQTRQYMELELQLVDGFAVLSRFELRVGIDGALPLPAEIAEGNVGYGETEGTLSDRIMAVLGDAGWPLALTDVFTGNVRVGPKVYGPGSTALEAIWDAADAEFPGVANIFMSKDGLFRFRGRQARFRPDVAQYGIQRRTVGDPSATELDTSVVPISELEWSLGRDNLFNTASATPQGVGSGTAWRQLDPEIDNVDGQYVENTTSIDQHGPLSITFDQLQTIEGLHTGNNSMVETKLFATYYVENYADPVSRISTMVFKSRRPGALNGTALWLHLCKCEISDLLTLKTVHPGGGGFTSEEFYVEGIHCTCRPGHPDYPVIELSLDVSPRAHYTINPFDADPDPAP